MSDRQFAHVQPATLARHHNADRNVLSMRSVHRTERASISNVWIRVRIRVALVQFVMLAITIQFALVQMDILAIHLYNASEFVSIFESVQLFFQKKSEKKKNVK